MLVKEVMTSPVIGVLPSASVADAATLMLGNRISGLPVMEADGRLVGVVSEGDFLRREELGTKRRRSWLLELFASPGKVADEYVHANGRKIEEIMASEVITTTPEAPLESAVDLMSRKGIKRLPVVDGGKVVGIVTRTDLLRALLRVSSNPVAGPTDDEKIRSAILAEMGRQIWSANGAIRVSVNQGVAELSGVIFDERERSAACVAAENVPGVKSVVDQLTWVEPMSGMVILPPGAS